MPGGRPPIRWNSSRSGPPASVCPSGRRSRRSVRSCSRRCWDSTTPRSPLSLIFHWADKKGLPLLDLKDLRSVIAFLTGDEGKAELKNIGGGVSRQTAGVILRALTNLEADGGDTFFGEPEVEPADLIRLAADGRGIITLFELGAQAARPALFSTFLMWILADLFEFLPEVATSTSRSWSSSSTSRICCSTTRPRRSTTRSCRR